MNAPSPTPIPAAATVESPLLDKGDEDWAEAAEGVLGLLASEDVAVDAPPNVD